MRYSTSLLVISSLTRIPFSEPVARRGGGTKEAGRSAFRYSGEIPTARRISVSVSSRCLSLLLEFFVMTSNEYYMDYTLLTQRVGARSVTPTSHIYPLQSFEPLTTRHQAFNMSKRKSDVVEMNSDCDDTSHPAPKKAKGRADMTTSSNATAPKTTTADRKLAIQAEELAAFDAAVSSVSPL